MPRCGRPSESLQRIAAAGRRHFRRQKTAAQIPRRLRCTSESVFRDSCRICPIGNLRLRAGRYPACLQRKYGNFPSSVLQVATSAPRYRDASSDKPLCEGLSLPTRSTQRLHGVVFQEHAYLRVSNCPDQKWPRIRLRSRRRRTEPSETCHPFGHTNVRTGAGSGSSAISSHDMESCRSATDPIVAALGVLPSPLETSRSFSSRERQSRANSGLAAFGTMQRLSRFTTRRPPGLSKVRRQLVVLPALLHRWKRVQGCKFDNAFKRFDQRPVRQLPSAGLIKHSPDEFG